MMLEYGTIAWGGRIIEAYKGENEDFLVRDSGYTLSTNQITPVLATRTMGESRYKCSVEMNF